MAGAATRVSIVLTTYNGAAYLPVQLQSLAEQTRLPDELIVSDDGSTDSTLEVLREFGESAPFPVSIHRQPTNLGADQNFAAALALATGDILFCCDQDDAWHADKLARVLDLFDREPSVGLVMNDADLVDETLHPQGGTLWQQFGFDESRQDAVDGGRAFEIFARQMPVYGCTIAVRSALRAHFLPIPPGPTFDSWIGGIAAVQADVRLIRQPLQQYRQHAAQVTGFRAGGRIRRALGILSRGDTAHVAAEAVRLEAMHDRLQALPESGRRSVALELTADRLRLTRRRLIARRSLIRRVPLIARSVLDGGYGRAAQGLRSAAVDLLARPERLW